MRLTCTQENLKKGLIIVGQATTQDGSLPVLGNILIKASENRIKLAATNLEVGVVTFINGKVIREGALTIPARLIIDYINSLPNKNIDLEMKNNEIAIKCADYQARIKGIDAEEFPIIPKIKNKPQIKLKVEDLREAISQTVFAAAMDESRPEITGVYFEINNKEIILAATDSFRLAEKKIKQTTDIKEEIKVIIPSRTLQELNRILNEVSGEVKIAVSNNQASFEFDNINLISRLIEGQYPDYKQIIPDKSLTQIQVPLTDFAAVVKTTSLFARKGGNDLDVAFNPGKGEITVSAMTAQVGENKAKIKAKISGEAGKIIFNFKYLLDGLANIKSTNLLLEVSGEGAPGVLKTEKQSDYTYIIMPIKQ